jgi:GT2 family glycosyltransferase
VPQSDPGPGPAPLVSVIVVNYNGADALERCLEALVADTDDASAEVLVVDNASSDGSPEMVRSEFPEISLLPNTTNEGYGAAMNDALRSTRSPYVLVLNADTRLISGSIHECIRHMEAHPRVGLVGPRLTNPDGSVQWSAFPFPGTLAWLRENNPVGPVLRHLPSVRQQMLRYRTTDRPLDVPWVLGAALLIRRETFDAVGGFDESYFMYYEEVDFCYRLLRTGWAVHFDPRLTIEHVGAASTSQLGAPMITQHFYSTRRFYRRYYTGLRLSVWLNLMRVKMAACSVEAAVRLLLPASAEARGIRKAHLKGWLTALFGPEDSRPGKTH